MGIVCFDYDDDGDTDIFVGNDSSRNFLFQNQGNGKFIEVGLLSGVAYDRNGEVHASMGVGCGDYNNDGRLDLYVTSYQRQFATLYENLGEGLFEDVTSMSGAGQGTAAALQALNGPLELGGEGVSDIRPRVGAGARKSGKATLNHYAGL